jgi:NADH-quinone oxidoreductase subunit C
VTSAFLELTGEVLGPDAELAEDFGVLTATVASQSWVAALQEVRDGLGCRFFDWLTAVDDVEDGFQVLARAWSLERHEGLVLRTLLPPEAPALDTATPVYRGANWHERETHEMFGIDFVGHPHLVPLLLPDQFEGHPLRKEFVLAARAAKPWPGAKEPGESEHVPPTRRRTVPPGVPDPSWGPRPPAGGQS